MKPAPAASMAWCAAISTTPKSAPLAESSISTTETGLKAAAPLSKMPAEIWRFCAGQSLRIPQPTAPSRPASPHRRLFPRRARRLQPGPIPGVAARLKILIVTDAWKPQVNGVVRTLEVLGEDLTALGHQVRYATPEGRFTVPMPTYPEIRLAIFPRAGLEKEIREFAPDAIHIATEGTLGLSARAICIKYAIPYTTSFHTRFPEYVRARFPFIPEETVYRFLRWFHSPATAMMVATPSLKREMEGHGFRNLRI